MSSMTLWFGCLALLLMGASLMLWAESVRRREREASRSFVRAQTEQINARYQPNAEAVPASVPDSITRAWNDALRRADMLNICEAEGVAPWNDPTNTDQTLMRARIRHAVCGDGAWVVRSYCCLSLLEPHTEDE